MPKSATCMTVGMKQSCAAIWTVFAFNIGWHEVPKRTIYSFIEPRGYLTKPGFANHTGDHSSSHVGFPELIVVR
jgi:hypothetical protein